MAPNTIMVAGCAQAACQKKTRNRLVGRVAKCPQLRANCVNHQPLRPLMGYNILPMYAKETRLFSLSKEAILYIKRRREVLFLSLSRTGIATKK